MRMPGDTLTDAVLTYFVSGTKWLPVSRKALRWLYFIIPSRFLEVEINLSNYRVLCQLFLFCFFTQMSQNIVFDPLTELRISVTLSFMDFYTYTLRINKSSDLLSFYTCPGWWPRQFLSGLSRETSFGVHVFFIVIICSSCLPLLPHPVRHSLSSWGHNIMPWYHCYASLESLGESLKRQLLGKCWTDFIEVHYFSVV
jgi:hypothetical protein